VKRIDMAAAGIPCAASCQLKQFSHVDELQSPGFPGDER
jgi:hypothetical protein